jgi:hypothetical protein
MRPSTLRKSTQSMSELETPARSATACAKIVPCAEDFRIAYSSSRISAARAFGLDKAEPLS